MKKKEKLHRVNWKRRAKWLESEMSERVNDFAKRLVDAEKQTMRFISFSIVFLGLFVLAFLMVSVRLRDSREQVDSLSFASVQSGITQNFLLGELNVCRSELSDMTASYVFEKNSPPMFVNECCFPVECGFVALSNPAICKCEFIGFCG